MGMGRPAGAGSGSRSSLAAPTSRSTPSASTRSASCSRRPAGRAASPGTAPSTSSGCSRIKELQRQGFSLAVIRRLLDGELDATDVPLAAAVAGAQRGDAELLDLDELAARVGVPAPLLEAVVREGLLVPQQRDGRSGYTVADVDVLRAGLRLLEAGFPLPDLLALARRHHEATRAIAGDAVEMFDEHVRRPLQPRTSPTTRRPSASSRRSARLLPTVTTLVAHHFRSVLLEVAQEHLEAVGDADRARGRAQRARLGTRASRDGRARTRRFAARGRREARTRSSGMFDRLAPRYDRMNRVISLGLDRRLAPAHGRRAGGCPRARSCSTSRAAPATSAATSRPSGTAPSASTSRPGCSRPRTTSAPLVRGDGAALPFRDGSFDGVVCGFALRNFVELDVRVRRDARACCAPAAASPRSTPPCRPTPCIRAGNAVWFRGAVPLLGRVLAHDADAYRYLPKSHRVPPVAPDARGRRSAKPASPTRAHTRSPAVPSSLLTGTRA